MGNALANGLTIPHVAGVAPSVPKGTPDPCRHRRNKKKQIFVVYIARETGSSPPKYYVGRTRGTGTLTQVVNNRERGHHRTDIGKLTAVCQADSYSACRGAEQKHYDDMVTNSKAITTPRSKGKGAQIAPISADNKKKKDYMECATNSARPSPPGCPICAK
jgi:hypothetical protein